MQVSSHDNLSQLINEKEVISVEPSPKNLCLRYIYGERIYSAKP
ncbi:hypothetical protein [Psychrobacter jeotgali]|nr:hypothetical protein [Psychrobacter jeotgali]